MLASSAQITRRAGCVHPASLRSLGVSNGGALQRHRQTRGFRFGRGWASYFENESKPDDIYRRDRSFRYKYIEAHRQRHQPLSEDLSPTKRQLKRVFIGGGCRKSEVE